MRTRPWLSIVYVPLVVILLVTGWRVVDAALDYAQLSAQIAARLNSDEAAGTAGKRLLEALSLGLYDGYTRELEEVERLSTLANQRQQQALQSASLFAIGAVCLLLFATWKHRQPGIAYGALAVATGALLIGLTAPVLTVASYTNLPLVGEVVLQFESKGVFTTISTLFRVGSYLIGGLLLLFSVLIPLVKSLLLGATLFARTHHWSARWLRWVKHLGKWSMTDVFVVAILVAYFALDTGKFTRAQPQIGLYFFAGYVVLSMVAALLIDRYQASRSPGSRDSIRAFGD